MTTLPDALASLRPVPGGTPADRLDVLRPVLEAWQRPESDVRSEALETLAATGAYGRGMLALGLGVAAARIAPLAVRRMIEEDHPRLHGTHPRRTAIIQAGNIPGLSLLDIVLSAVAGDVVALKAPAGEPVTGRLLARAVGAAAVFEWRGGTDPDRALFDWCDHLLAYGGDDTLAAITRATAGARLHRELFGHRVSAAWVHEADVADPELPWRLAFDVAMWDQEGCLSPHVLFVSGRAPLEPFLEGLGRALDHAASVLPAGARTLERKAARRAFLSRAEAASLADPGVIVRTGRALAWILVAADRGPATPSPLGRVLTVRRIRSEAELFRLLTPWAGRLQALGVSRLPRDATDWASRLAALGATRLCRVGRMQEPSPAWIGEERGHGELRVAVEPEADGAWRTIRPASWTNT